MVLLGAKMFSVLGLEAWVVRRIGRWKWAGESKWQEHSLVPVGFVYCGPQGSSNSVGRLLDQGTEAGSRAGSTCPSPHPRLSFPLLYEVELDHLEGECQL